MGDATTRPKLIKSRNGCLECKRKRMKCDEAVPCCRNCIHRKVECPGYKRNLKWSTKYERFKLPSPAKASPKRPASPLRKQIQDVIQAIGTPKPSEDAPTPGNGLNVETPRTPATDLPSANTWEEALFSPDREQPGPEALRTNARAQQTESTRMAVDPDSSAADPEPSDDLDAIFQQMLPGSPNHFDEPDEEEVTRSERAIDRVACSSDLHEYLSLWSDFTLLNDDSSANRLIPHYFEQICRVMSCFDSITNPYRTDIPSKLHNSQHIFNAMMGMSAAHMANFAKEMAVTAITYQTQAMNSLQQEMSNMLPSRSAIARRASLATTYELLLGTIMLGMTSAWHDPSANGLSHLQGARLLFKAWSVEQCLTDSEGRPRVLNRDESFIVGSMSYWECLSSFIMDQASGAIDYLKPFCSVSDSQVIYPNPWTGVSTPIFIRLAQVGILLRQKRVLEKLTLIRRGGQAKGELDADLLDDARAIHQEVLEYHLPDSDQMEDTGDANTPINHLREVAKVYRYTALMELYRAFPQLSASQSGQDDLDLPSKKAESVGDLAFDIATSIITIISDVPQSSGIYTVLCLPFVATGSALQIGPTCVTQEPGAKASLGDELTRVRRSKAAVLWWREIIRQQILHTSRRIGLAVVHRVAKLVQEVWTRSDMHTDMSSTSDASAAIHWIDVMTDQHLETIYG